MLVIISPAKTMGGGASKIKVPEGTVPRFMDEAKEVALSMTQFSAAELGKMLKINPKLAAENYLRFQHFHSEDSSSLPAILAYTGIVFQNISPKDFTSEDFLFTQDTLRIASFGYGLLRPLDKIKPYRMEFDVKLPELGDGNMYSYWKDKLTPAFIDDIRQSGGVLVNLASMDIQGVFRWKEVGEETRIITPEFKVWRNGKPQTIVIYAKMARGQMTRHIIKNRITNPEDLKAFRWEGFCYQEELSNQSTWVFLQE